MKRGAVVFGLAALVAATPAAARPVYFHKASIDRHTYTADLGQCEELAGGVRKPAPLVTYSPNMAALALNSFFNGFYQSKQKRRMVENVLRTCMADKGYRRVEASQELVRELDRLDAGARLDRLFALVGAPEPMGEPLPQ